MHTNHLAAPADVSIVQVQNRRLGLCNELRGWVSDNLANVSQAMGQIDQAKKFARTALRVCACAYPTNSTAVAYQKLRIAKLEPDPLRSRMYSEALQVLSLHFGNNLEM